jgi:ATP phosphoribosyltransferase
MNVPVARIDEVVKILPSLHAPTVNHLSDPGWLAVETVVDRQVVRGLIPSLNGAGAEGILELQLNKMC